MRWPNVLRGNNPDGEGKGGWRTGRVALLAAGGVGLGLILANAIARPVEPPAETEDKKAETVETPWQPKSLTAYARVEAPAPEPPPEPEPQADTRGAVGDPIPLQPAAPPTETAQPPAALVAAGSAGIGVWSGQAVGGRASSSENQAPPGNEAAPSPAPGVGPTVGAGGGCLIAAGTVLPAQLVTAASSDQAGTVVARVARDVLGAGGCLGIRAGATLVGAIAGARDFAQERGEVVFEALYTLDGRAVDLAAAAGDAMGRGGVPGDADLHAGAKALRVAVASAIDLGGAYLGGRGDGFNILFGNGGRAVDEWARQALERKPSITLDPLKQPTTLTVILKRPIAL